jgi:hypothetical protein
MKSSGRFYTREQAAAYTAAPGRGCDCACESRKAGRAAYALHKRTVEAVFGIIKSVMGFRQFMLRGLEKVTGEWRLVCLAWNLKRMAALRPQ